MISRANNSTHGKQYENMHIDVTAPLMNVGGGLMQLQKSSEEREAQAEELAQELKAAHKEIGRLQPLEQRVKDLINELKQSQADKDRCCSGRSGTVMHSAGI